MYKIARNTCIVILILVLILMYGGSALTKMAFSRPVDIYQGALTDASRLKRGFAIQTELPVLMECFGSQTSTQTNTYDNSTLIGDAVYYYIMPITVGEEIYYVALETSAKNDNYDMLKELSHSTMASGDAEPVPITGGLLTLDDELYEYMKQWFEETEWFEDKADIEKYVLPLKFSEENYTSNRIVFFVELTIAIALLAGIILFSIKEKKAAASAQKADSEDQNASV